MMFAATWAELRGALLYLTIILVATTLIVWLAA